MEGYRFAHQYASSAQQHEGMATAKCNIPVCMTLVEAVMLEKKEKDARFNKRGSRHRRWNEE